MDEIWAIGLSIFVILTFLVLLPQAIQDFWFSRIWCRLTGGHEWPDTLPDRGWNRCLRGCGAWEK